MESEARQQWRLVKENFVAPESQIDNNVQASLKRTAALERWRLLQKAFLPEMSATSSRVGYRKPSPMGDTRIHYEGNKKPSPRRISPTRSSSQRLRAISAQTAAQKEKTESGVRVLSITDIDSPYRAALSDLADFDWQFSETERKTPLAPTVPQFSTIHYHPNHEAFYDEERGVPIPKSSTMSLKQRGSCSTTVLFQRRLGLPDVDETASRTCLQGTNSRRKRIVSIRLRNLRLSISQTVGRCLRACLYPDALT